MTSLSSRKRIYSHSPQLAASFISNQTSNVAYWHLTDNSAAPAFVAYWGNNGQNSAQSLNG
jgi:hypothetical protein